MSDNFIPYGRQTVSEEDIAAVVACLRGDWLTQGPRVAEFEAALCQATGASHAVAVSSGTAALHIANLGLGLRAGDVGVVPAITFVATANAIRYCGADVEFVDVNPTTGSVSGEALAKVLARLAAEGRTPKLVAPVYMAGHPLNAARLADLASEHGAFVLEDAAHALGAQYDVNGARHTVGACRHSTAAIASFHPVKALTTAEGGAVLTNDASLAERLRELRSHGIHKDSARFTRGNEDPFVGPWYYEQSSLGYNYRIPDVLCSLGTAQLSRLAHFVECRRAIADRYDKELAQLSALIPLRWSHGGASAYHLYVVQVVLPPTASLQSIATRRRALYEFLRSRGIGSQVHYIPVPWQPAHRGSASIEAVEARFPGAARYYASSLSIPIFPTMTESDIDRVIAALRQWSAQYA